LSRHLIAILYDDNGTAASIDAKKFPATPVIAMSSIPDRTAHGTIDTTLLMQLRRTPNEGGAPAALTGWSGSSVCGSSRDTLGRCGAASSSGCASECCTAR
jgi:hypothetical protein